MTTVANMPVPGDILGGAHSGGKKNRSGMRDTFLGPANAPCEGKYHAVAAGTLGGSVGPGTGLPGASAGVLTSIESPKKQG